jgi:hypothetical protein
MAKAKEKNPVGRPTLYDPKYCQIAIDFLKDGYSVTALAGHIGVARSTVFRWAEENDDFSDALTSGQALAALWWENRLRDIAQNGADKKGAASVAIFGVKNRSREEWKDHHNLTIDDMPSPFDAFIQLARGDAPDWDVATKPDPKPEEEPDA